MTDLHPAIRKFNRTEAAKIARDLDVTYDETGAVKPDNAVVLTIPASFLEEAQSRFETFVKKAVKLDLEPPRMDVACRYTVLQGSKIYPGERDSPREKWYKCRPSTVAYCSQEKAILHIYGSAPNVDGWTFAGVIMHYGEISILKTTGEEGIEIPERFRNPGPYCEHCKTKRRRNETYILFNEETNEYLQVGRTCLKDFGGHYLEKIGSYWRSLVELGEDEDWIGGGGKFINPSTSQYLAHVLYAIENYGWVSGGMAYNSIDGLQSTAGTGWDLCNPPSSGFQSDLQKKEQREIKEQWDRLHAEALDAIEWGLAQETPEAFGYILNLSRALRVGFVDSKLRGLVASVFTAKAKAEERELARRRRSGDWAERCANSEYVGEIKKRMRGIEAVLVKTRDIPSDFGYKCLHEFETDGGNVLVWWASSRPHTENEVEGGLEIGATYRFDGTPKKQEEYNGLKQTTLGRCSKFSLVKGP